MRFKERNDFIGQWIFLGSVTNWLGAGHTCTYLKEACFYCRHASERPHIVWSHAALPVHLEKAFKVAANIQPTRGNRAYEEHYGGQVRCVPGVLLLLGWSDAAALWQVLCVAVAATARTLHRRMYVQRLACYAPLAQPHSQTWKAELETCVQRMLYSANSHPWAKNLVLIIFFKRRKKTDPRGLIYTP